MTEKSDLWVAVLRLEVTIPGARSRKDRRQVVRSLKDRLVHRFGVACAEIGSLSSWTRASLGVTGCSNEKAELEKRVQAIVRYAQNDPAAMVGTAAHEIFRYEEES